MRIQFERIRLTRELLEQSELAGSKALASKADAGRREQSLALRNICSIQDVVLDHCEALKPHKPAAASPEHHCATLVT